MAEKPETKFKKKVKKRLETLRGCWFVKTQMLSLLGIPDYLICYHGRFAAWELKVRPNVATPKQKRVLALIRAAGGLGHVVYPDTLEDAMAELLATKQSRSPRPSRKKQTGQ